MKALIEVDVQNDFALPNGKLYVPDGSAVVYALNRMMMNAHENPKEWIAIQTQDTHDYGNQVHFNNWPEHCIVNSYGWELVSNLYSPEDFPFLLRKGMNPKSDGYSPFMDDVRITRAGAEVIGNLDDIFRAFNVEEVYIGGLATDWCVKAAVIDSLQLGYKTYLLGDAIRGVLPDDASHAVEEMLKRGARLTSSESLLLKTQLGRIEGA